MRYVEVVNGVKTEHNLCGHCAAQLDLGQFSAVFEGEMSLAKLLSGLLGIQHTEQRDERIADVACPSCGTSYAEFVEGSRFGCADCYSVFGPLLGENIRHLQGSERHVGKRPGHVLRAEAVREAAETKASAGPDGGEPLLALTKEEQIRLLQARLKDALRREDYEDAAELRDEIRSLKEETR